MQSDFLSVLDSGFLALREKGLIQPIRDAYLVAPCESTVAAVYGSGSSQLDLMEASGLYAIITFGIIGTGIVYFGWFMRMKNKTMPSKVSGLIDDLGKQLGGTTGPTGGREENGRDDGEVMVMRSTVEMNEVPSCLHEMEMSACLDPNMKLQKYISIKR